MRRYDCILLLFILSRGSGRELLISSYFNLNFVLPRISPEEEPT